MKITQTLLFLGLSVASPLLAEPVLRPAGVQVCWEDYREMFDGFGVFNGGKGTTVALHLQSPDAPVIILEDEHISVTSLTDDQGGKLNGEPGMFNRISADGRNAVIYIQADETPSNGTTSLKLEGEISFLTATETATERAENVALKAGESVSAGESFSFVIKEAGKPDWGDDPWSVTLQWNRDIPELAEIRFFAADGTVIESDESGSSRMGFGNQVTLEKTWNLSAKVDVVHVEVVIWKDMQLKTIPLNLSVSLGG